MMTPEGMKRVESPDDVPNGHHFAVIILDKGSVDIPGDERSRTNPGHGYPAYTQSYNDYQYFVTTDQRAMEKFVESLESEEPFRSKKPYVFFTVAAKGSVKKKIQFEFPPATR
jgi:hypothetical protein